MSVPTPPPTALKRPRGLRSSLFSCYYQAGNYLSRVATRNQQPWAHRPLAIKTMQLYRNRERGTLWWSVPIHTLPSGTKRAVRSWCARRVRHAFRQALREQGFDDAGKKLVLDEAGNVVDRRKALQGTMELRLGPPLIHANYDRILHQARRTVTFLSNEAQVPDGQK